MATSFELKRHVEGLLAEERGTIVKEAPHRVALVYPSPYRVGMSSLGFQSIYRELNRRDDVVCERSFLPDDPEGYRRSHTPLFTYESETPVGDCDVVAFSFSYEVEIIGMLTCLELAGIPLRQQERGSHWPLVVVGGPITFSNPLPIGPFADVVVMGEGEELVHLVIDWWKDYEDRESFLQDLAMVPGIYVPSVHGATLRPVAQARDEYLPAFAPILTPNTELSSMHLVENARGCHRGCTFCVMRRTTNGGMRTVPAQKVLATIPEYAERVGLVGAATSDHPEILDIMRAVVDGGRQVSLSSLRADRLDEEFVQILARGGAKTLTVASDGTSQRMRDFARKGIKERHLERCAELVRDHQMKLLKLYMVFGYPGETMADIEEMIGFLRELSKICNVALGLSPLVAKKNTPLDGSPFENQKVIQERIKRIHRELGGQVEVRATSARWAWIEYELAQGGFDMADAAEEAYRRGAKFGAWKAAIERHRAQPAPLATVGHRLKMGAVLPQELKSL
jgi:radical SAM superfamily enzyme YgiQ (UPF0313 family)